MPSKSPYLTDSVSAWVLQRDRSNWVYMQKDFKSLADKIVGAGKSEICSSAGPQAATQAVYGVTWIL